LACDGRAAGVCARSAVSGAPGGYEDLDEKVLEAQRWVNATYGGRSGYNRCPEDGITGWSTMYSLTRGLQLELGITTPSDSFGPTTLARLAALGTIDRGFDNENILNIIKHGLWCKGYPGGYGDNYSADAVSDLKWDAGINPWTDDAVPPKVFKALLTMDAYVLMAGGTAAVREVQRWLNTQYLARRDFFVIPCDGVFSRNVQKALYLAIQFELGLSDDQATGVFGPATREGLREHEQVLGYSGPFTSIFSGAVVFNRVRLSSGNVYDRFTDTFDEALEAAVREFQAFSELPRTGMGDFGTWCQLLVSTGDPDRAATACDCVTAITDARAAALRAGGYTVVGRYLENVSGGKNKQLQPGELETIFRNGMRVFPISQYDGGYLAYFTYSRGYQDALSAHDAAVRHGFGTGSVIYFAVDYDATQADIDSNIVPYFMGVVGGLATRGKRYVHGVYGSRNVCEQVTRRTYARWSFVSGMSAGYSGNMGFPLPENWAFNQIKTVWVGTGDGRIEIDRDVHRGGADPGVASVNGSSSPVDAFVAYIRRLYELAVSYGGSRSPSQLVLEFLRHENYNDLQWQTLIGEIDAGFVNRVRDAGVTMIRELRDPFYGIDLNVAHLGASCNGVLVHGKPDGTSTGRGDVADWGGDWMTFYGEWRRDADSYASGRTYCQERLAKIDGNGTFKLRDLIEDADAFNMGMRLRAGRNIVEEVVYTYQGGGYLSRMRRFFEGRFGTGIDAKAIARDMLMPGLDEVVNLGRAYLIQTTGGVPTLMPHLLPGDRLDEFCQGFVDMLLDRVGQENAQVQRMRAEGTLPR
jgi:peptidoglycan hydrolase-like protein with peptidoglycan-binding domain